MGKPANQIVHWPGQDTAACEDHLQQLRGVASAMGFHLSATPCEETTCDNCTNKENAERKGSEEHPNGR